MDAVKLNDKLVTLLSKKSINDADVSYFVKWFVHLSEEAKVEGRFQTYGPVVKKWIGAYQNIFSEVKIDGTVKTCIRKYCKIFTEVFLDLMQLFRKYDSQYLDFHYNWKLIMSETTGQKRAKYFCRFGQQFKELIENLRTATHRCEQFAILSVLLLYIEDVSVDELNKFKDNSNIHIIKGLSVLTKQPTTLSQHAFLHDIDATGFTIISMKATHIICDSISLNINASMYSLWIDFNMIEHSITLCGVSSSENKVTFFATLSRPKIRERLAKRHELKIRGAWSILKHGTNTFQKKTTISVHLPIHDRNAVWKAKVKSLFTFVTDSSVSSQLLSQDSSSDRIDLHWLAKLTVDNIRITASQHVSDLSFTSVSRIDSPTVRDPFTLIALQQYDDEYGHLLNDLATKQWIQRSTFNALFTMVEKITRQISIKRNHKRITLFLSANKD